MVMFRANSAMGTLYYSVDLGKFVINVVEVNVYRDSFKRARGHSEDDCLDPRFAYRRINILFYIGTEGVQGIRKRANYKIASHSVHTIHPAEAKVQKMPRTNSRKYLLNKHAHVIFFAF